MAKNGNGGIGTSCQLFSLGVPDIRASGLSKEEKSIRKSVSHRLRTDPEYAARFRLKQQLSQINSPNSCYSKARKSKISLPKFSWDEKEGT